MAWAEGDVPVLSGQGESCPDLRTICYRIPEGIRERTAGAFLRSRRYSKHMISCLRSTEIPDFYPEREGKDAVLHGILLNGRPILSTCPVQPGDLLTVNILETEDSPNIVETELPLRICYEDEDLLVVEKPAGMPVHPSMGHYENTLGNALAFYTRRVLGHRHYVFRVVNRLDRDTSGLLIAAKNMLAAALLGSMVENREIHREYLAVCAGDIRSMAGEEPAGIYRLQTEEGFHMTINVPLGRKEGSVIERKPDYGQGEYAVTHLQLLAYNAAEDSSLVRLKLETGRTHQIRVHMKYAGHPLLGDFLYNPGGERPGRQALHSWKLSFQHPITGESLHFTAPLPEDLKGLLSRDAGQY